MKAVPRLPAEPPGLAAYRSANPVDDAAPGSEAKDVWERFRSDPAYKELRDALVAVQGGLCAYCEQRVTKDTGELIALDQQVEHVLAKSGGPSRTLDWTNLVLSCGGGTYRHHREKSRQGTGRPNESCGQRKSDADLRPGCDPRTFPLLLRLVDVGLDGTLSANTSSCAQLGIAPAELEQTINVILNLNCDRLRRARRKVADNIRKWVVEIANYLLNSMHLSAGQQSEFLDLMVAGRLQPDRHGHLRAFWSTERQFLPWSESWLTSNAHQLNLGSITSITPPAQGSP